MHWRTIIKTCTPLALVTAYAWGTASADVPEAQREEVAHLLEYVRTSPCLMERNGKRHKGEDAYSHVKRKYDYFRDEIRTTEDFIDYSATKSTMSGRYYSVVCDGQPAVRTRDWLLQELEDYRARGASR